MKTTEIVKTANGYYVTRRYCGQNKGMQFFPFKKKVERGQPRWNGLKEAQNWAKDWTGE